MANEDNSYEALVRELKQRQRNGEVAELDVSPPGSPEKRVAVRAVGNDDWLRIRVAKTLANNPNAKIITRTKNDQNYYFMSNELRPGSGVIRSFGGQYEGPGGTLTCFLSSKDGRDRYFAAAGHVLSNFWTGEDVEGAARQVPPTASIHRYQKGFPATRSTRFLGKLKHLSSKPKAINPRPDHPEDEKGEARVAVDVGIVKLRGEIESAQRTTCYGHFGEWPSYPDERVYEGQTVMKCGAEEPHWTYARVKIVSTPVTVYGPAGLLYEIQDQIILEVAPGKVSSYNTDPPVDWSARSLACQTPFAVPGDSGTMVVDQESKKPVGMLIAGSVLDGLYVMTPIQAIWRFWQKRGLIFLRA